MTYGLLKLTVLGGIFCMMFSACNTEPSKAAANDPINQIKPTVSKDTLVGTVYINNEIGWTINIPAGFEILKNKDRDSLNKAGTDELNKKGVEYVNIDGMRHLICFKGSGSNAFISTVAPPAPDYKGSLKDACSILYRECVTFGGRVDSTYSMEEISGIRFYRFELDLYKKSGEFAGSMVCYMKKIHDLAFCAMISYNNTKEKNLLNEAFKNSKFTR